MSLPPEVDDFIKQTIDHSLGLPISPQTLDIMLRAVKQSDQILRDQNASLLDKLKEKDELIEQTKYEACLCAQTIKTFVEENQKLAVECENLLEHCRRLEKEFVLYENDREALIVFQNEAEERAGEAYLRIEELERDLVMYKMRMKECLQENESVDSSSTSMPEEESLLDSLMATVTTKDDSSTYEFLVANSENEHCKKLLSMWSGLKQSSRRVFSLVADVMSLEKDKEHLRINLDRAEEEGKLLFVENSKLEKENKRLLVKLSHSASAKSSKRKSSPKTSSPMMRKKIDFDDSDSVSSRQPFSPLQSNSPDCRQRCLDSGSPK